MDEKDIERRLQDYRPHGPSPALRRRIVERPAERATERWFDAAFLSIRWRLLAAAVLVGCLVVEGLTQRMVPSTVAVPDPIRARTMKDAAVMSEDLGLSEDEAAVVLRTLLQSLRQPAGERRSLDALDW